MKVQALAIAGILAAGMIYMKSTISKKTLSQNGLNFIKAHEGYSGTMYLDQAGKPTIGYGHLIKPGESFNTITSEQAEALLSADVYFAVSAVNDNVKVSLTQNQFDSLVSFVFNIGVNAFRDSTLLLKLNAGDYIGAFHELPRWNKVTINGSKVVSDGLVNRRQAEQALFFA